MNINLWPHQQKALDEMHTGCVLRGGVGSGKSMTSLAYFYTKVMGGKLNPKPGEQYGFANELITTLLIITPAKKRDDLEWERELSNFALSTHTESSLYGFRVIVDSWQNISKYVDVTQAFVIFDEQRLVGSGAWVKSFYKIAANNQWIILSATPGDNWMDYIPIFVANGFYKNKTEFVRQHVVFNRFSKFPKVDYYIETGKLRRLQRRVLVEMPFRRHTSRNVSSIRCGFDKDLYDRITKTKIDPWTDEPIQNIVGLIHAWRRVVNSDQSRKDELRKLFDKHPRLIIYYNFTYELEILRGFMEEYSIPYTEWNGQKHQEIPDTESWGYLVQYTAGAEAWNCITTDAMVFYSQQYSYKIFEQCQGRIDRMNTPYSILHYYVLYSNSKIDHAIDKALAAKENFNIKSFEKSLGGTFSARNT